MPSEIESDFNSIRVHTRQQLRAAGARQGWHKWPDPDGGQGKVPYFDINLM